MVSRITVEAVEQLELTEGSRVTAAIKAQTCSSPPVVG
ncbi:MAG: TOBE domain-containing protein [Solirubrobacteraceae bacterium]